jgi:tetrahydromethanopterin S-methyltransferase subunit A
MFCLLLEGRTAGALYQSAISRNLVSRLDHAAYLGRELARAEQNLGDGTQYIQERDLHNSLKLQQVSPIGP